MRSQTELTDVFETADYCVEHAGKTVTLELYRPAPEPLAEWLIKYNGSAAAWLITACNPGGEVAPAAENQARESWFDIWLDRPGLDCLPAINRDTTGNWPDEPGWLVAGLEEGMARSLARRLGQVAIVAVHRASVDLIWVGSPC